MPNAVGAVVVTAAGAPKPAKPAGIGAVVAPAGVPNVPNPGNGVEPDGAIPNPPKPPVVAAVGAAMLVVVDPKPLNAVDAGVVAPKLPNAGAAVVAGAPNPPNSVGADVAAGVADCAPPPNVKPPVCWLAGAPAMLKGWATPTGAPVVADCVPKANGWGKPVVAEVCAVAPNENDCGCAATGWTVAPPKEIGWATPVGVTVAVGVPNENG